MTTYYKGQDVLLRAVARLLHANLDIELRLAGDGPIRSAFERIAHELGIRHKVVFLGVLPGPDAVREQLDKADLLVFPSRSEGLPRVVIEAMARGLPCIASRAGGIPELLAPEDMIQEVDEGPLASKIAEFLADPDTMWNKGSRNLQVAKGYRSDQLNRRREEFYRHVEESTAAWLRTRGVRG
jgi:glycosyltransferase involved in cell wall biosynthesis